MTHLDENPDSRVFHGGPDRFWEKQQTKAEVEVFILDQIYERLPTPPFTEEEKRLAAESVYAYVW